MTIARTWILLGAGALLTAGTEGVAQTRTTGSGIPVTKDVSTTPSTTTTTVVSGGEVRLTTPFSLSAYANMNEKNMTAFMATNDSLEIELGLLGQSKGTSQTVRDYALMLRTDHTAHLAKTIEIITDEDVGAEPMAFDPELMRTRQILAELRKMPAGTNWDAVFLRFHVEHHQNEIDLFTQNIKNAHDDDFEDHIEKSLTSFAKHRDAARSAGATLGLTL